MRPSFFHHLHPPTIPADQARWRYTLGAGGLSLFLATVLLVTGLLLMFYYVPTPEEAALSVQTLTFLVPYGGLVRHLHYWAAQFLVITAVIHLGRVLLTGAYARPRRFNYLLGVGLLILILFLDFTGYVLRWDEGIRWALVVGTNLLKTIPPTNLGQAVYGLVIGGTEPGAATLVRFYAWHIVGLFLPLLVMVGWHIFRVRRDGGIAAPPLEVADGILLGDELRRRERIDRFELVCREIIAALLAMAVLLLFATFLPAPIAPPIGTTDQQVAHAQAPWFFLWVQGLLHLGDPFWMGVLVPLGILVLIALIPYVLPQPPPEEQGRWLPRHGRLAQIVSVIVLVFLIVFTLRGLLDK